MIRAVTALLAAALSLAAPLSASAQAWPAKPVRIIVAYPPGGATDLQARLVAAKLNERWGVPVIVENKPGANTVIATDMVAKAAPDGQTVLLTAMPYALNPMLIARLPYDTAKDLVPVTLMATIPNVLVVYPGLPVNSLDDLIKLARAEPGSVSFASTGQATSTHLSGELFARMAGLRLNHIPYKGSAPAHLDLISGRVSMMFDNGALQHIRSGKLKALAVTSATRVPWLPDTPTMMEQGLAGYEAAAWYGVFAPGGTPTAIVRKLADEITWALRSPDTVEKLTAAGAIAVFGRRVLHQTYGTNEAVPLAGMGPEAWFAVVSGSEPMKAVGKPLPCADVEVWDEEGNVLPAGEVGEVVGKCDGQMDGYWMDPVETAKKVVNGWIKTGDLGRIDKNGYLYLTDRVGEMIISGGHNIYPGELEKIISGHPDVLEVCVFGIPDKKWGETPVAVCQVKRGSQVTDRDITSLVAKEIGSYMRPSRVQLVFDPLPKSAVGKISRKLMREAFLGA